LKIFIVLYEWKTRPFFHKGRLKTCEVGFSAYDQTEAYRLAKHDGEIRFARRQWRIISCKEILK
jgi:hypothetical protein